MRHFAGTPKPSPGSTSPPPMRASRPAEQEIKERQEGPEKAGESPTGRRKGRSPKPAKGESTRRPHWPRSSKSAQSQAGRRGALKKKVDDAAKAVTAAAGGHEDGRRALAGVARAPEGAEKRSAWPKDGSRTPRAKRQPPTRPRKAAIRQYDEATRQPPSKAAAPPRVGLLRRRQILATAGDEATVQLWDANTGRPLESEAGHAVRSAGWPFSATERSSPPRRTDPSSLWDTSPRWTFFGRIGPQARNSARTGQLVARRPRAVPRLQSRGNAVGHGRRRTVAERRTQAVEHPRPHAGPRDQGRPQRHGVRRRVLARRQIPRQRGGRQVPQSLRRARPASSSAPSRGTRIMCWGSSWKADGSLLAMPGPTTRSRSGTSRRESRRAASRSYAKQVTSIHFIGTGGDT